MQGGLVRPAFAVLSAGILESTVNTETEKDRFMSENTKNPAAEEFLPVCKADMLARGWRDVDFVLVTGDAYVDHPSFGAAIISRLLEAEGYRVGVLSQPDFTTCESMKEFGRPRYGFFIGGGNVDSMVAHYSVAKIRRAQDEYTPGGAAGKRPDRSATVYTQLAKQAYPDLPVILGGLEASLRRFAHYDYWLDDGAAQHRREQRGGYRFLRHGGTPDGGDCTETGGRGAGGGDHRRCGDLLSDGFRRSARVLCGVRLFCQRCARTRRHMRRACRIQMDNQDVVSGKPVVQKQVGAVSGAEHPGGAAHPAGAGRRVCALPFTRRYHPSYEALGGVPAIEEVEFSIIHNRGLLRRLQLLRHRPSIRGAWSPRAARTAVVRGGRGYDACAGLQGVYPRRGRPHCQLPPALPAKSR